MRQTNGTRTKRILMMSNSRGKKIVVFGCDNSGKTTLAQNISSHYDFTYVRSPGPISREGQIDFLQSKLFGKENMVFDRFVIFEENVCGNILRGSSNFSDFPKAVASDVFYSKVDLFIFCNPGIEEILNWGQREQMDGVKENAKKLWEGYKEVFHELKNSCLNVVEYNWKSKSSLDEVISKIQEVVEK